MKEIKHIVISGNIGVGKTTLSKKISKKFDWELQLEEVDDNPYLDDFYNLVYYNFVYIAFFPVSPVLILTVSSIVEIKILPSPILPV